MSSSTPVSVHRLKGLVPPRLIGAALAVHENRLFVHGGKYASSKTDAISSALYVLDLESHVWSRLYPPTRSSTSTAVSLSSSSQPVTMHSFFHPTADAPSPRFFHSLTYHKNRLYTYGGMKFRNATAADLWYFDLELSSWVELPASSGDDSAGRWAHCAGVCGSTLVVLGGQDADANYMGDILLFDLARNVWETQLRSLPSGDRYSVGFGVYRSTLIASCVGDSSAAGKARPNLVLFSNYNTESSSMSLDVISPPAVSFSHVPVSLADTAAPPFLRFPTGGVLGDYIIMGGVYLSTAAQNYAVHAYNTRTKRWTQVQYQQHVRSARSSWNTSFFSEAQSKYVLLGADESATMMLDDYHERIINFSHMLEIDLASFGIFAGRQSAAMSFSKAGQALGQVALKDGGFADMEIVCFAPEADGRTPFSDEKGVMPSTRRISVNSRILRERWGSYYSVLETAGEVDDSSVVESMPGTRRGTTTTVESFVSTVLEKRMYAPFEETERRVLFMPERYEVVRELVGWFYTGTIAEESDVRTLSGLLVLSRRCQIGLLRARVVERLEEMVDEALAQRASTEGVSREGEVLRRIYYAAAGAGEVGLLKRVGGV
ncbi:hypothetical protein BZA70DRAFT_280717, partial [Myxozyma melibiosi]